MSTENTNTVINTAKQPNDHPALVKKIGKILGAYTFQHHKHRNHER